MSRHRFPPKRAWHRASVYDVALRGGRQRLADAEAVLERGPAVAASVPTEDEFVQVQSDVLPAQPVAHAHGPALEAREDTMDPRQNLVRLAVAGHPIRPRFVGQAAVPEPVDSDGPYARRRSRQSPSAECGGVSRSPGARPPRTGGSCHSRCGPCLTRPSPYASPRRRGRGRAWTPLRPPRSSAAGCGSGRPWPGAACGEEEGSPRSCRSPAAVGVRSNEMHGEEPRVQRQVAAVHHRTRRRGGLASAGLATRDSLLEFLAGHRVVLPPSVG